VRIAWFTTLARAVLPRLPFAIAILTCFLVTVFTLRAPISRDSASGVQWAESIGTTFSFQNTEVPHLVYPPYLSNGGPLMYAGGLGFALTHDIDGALVAGDLLAAVVLLIGLMLLRPWFSAIPLVALFVWPIFAYVSHAFLAEIWATGLVVLGLALFERLQAIPTIPRLFADRRTWLVFLIFSLATWSKMVASLAIFGIIFATVYERWAARAWGLIVLNALRSLAVTVVACSIIGTLFFLEFGFAIVHTVRSVAGARAVPSMFRGLIDGMFGLANIGQASSARAFLGTFGRFGGQIGDQRSTHQLIIVILIAAAVLVLSKPSYALLVFIAGALYLHFGFDEREVLPVYFVILVLGIREIVRIVGRVAERRHLPAPLFEALSMAAVLLFLCLGNPVMGAPAADPGRRYGVNVWNGYEHYSPEMVAALKAHAHVFIAGILALPQVDASWNLVFYDRTSVENANLWGQDNVLLFDVAQFPKTTVADNCGSVIRTDGDLVLCNARKDVPLGYIPVPPPAGKMSVIDLADRSWTVTSGFQTALAGPHGSKDYEYVGTGGQLSDPRSLSAVALTVPVQPGTTYVFSAWVDPSNLSGDDRIGLNIFTAAGAIAGSSWPVGPPTRYSAVPWLCPPGINQVTLAMGLNFAVIPAGQKVRFSEPKLTAFTPR
jgi:hypothetical protein